ncbi:MULTISPECIES: hypothetical protein [Streptomycetaceae]|uniref:hypothetical protein n=1 Tax=Streptomycetaceae TaxID=2062 RepID=UPI00093A3C72|nr:hypothetical protein [Streptomyces sp. CB02056]OKI08914.1 hypothetical protein AMK13_11170 [Streptomyces sp. CB02056]
MKHPRALIAGGSALLLGGGLLGWHLYLDHTAYRPPAVALSHGECRGLLDDPAVTGLLGGAPRVFVETTYRAATPDAPASVRCSVNGGDGRLLTAEASFGGVLSGGDSLGAVGFECTVDGRRTGYRAVLRLTGKDGKLLPDGPGRKRMGEAARGFAERAAGQQLGCAGGAERLDVV